MPSSTPYVAPYQFVARQLTDDQAPMTALFASTPSYSLLWGLQHEVVGGGGRGLAGNQRAAKSTAIADAAGVATAVVGVGGITISRFN